MQGSAVLPALKKITYRHKNTDITHGNPTPLCRVGETELLSRTQHPATLQKPATETVIRGDKWTSRGQGKKNYDKYILQGIEGLWEAW